MRRRVGPRRLFPPSGTAPPTFQISAWVSEWGKGRWFSSKVGKGNGGRRGGEAEWWLSKVLNLELKLGWEGRQFSPLHRPPPAFLPYLPQTGTRYNLGVPDLNPSWVLQKSDLFYVSLFYFFLGEGDAAVVGEQTPKHLATSSHLRVLDTPVHAHSRALPESGRLSRTPPLFRTKNLSCLLSHTPNLGCPHSWSSPRLPSQGAASPAPLLGLWEFLDPPSPFSSPWVSLIIFRRPTRAPKEI